MYTYTIKLWDDVYSSSRLTHSIAESMLLSKNTTEVVVDLDYDLIIDMCV